MRSVLFIIFMILVSIELYYCVWKIVFSKDQKEMKKNKIRFFLVLLIVFIVAMKIYFSRLTK